MFVANPSVKENLINFSIMYNSKFLKIIIEKYCLYLGVVNDFGKNLNLNCVKKL